MYGFINTSFKNEDQVYSGTGFIRKINLLKTLNWVKISSRWTKKHCTFINSSRNVLVILAVIC